MKVISPNTLSATDGSFTRASVGSYFDKTGTMQQAAINVPRFNYDPNTLEFQGIMVEAARTNVLLNSTTLSTQTVTVSNAASYTVSFYGNGSIVLSNAHSATVVGTSNSVKTSLTFTTGSTSLTLTVSGSVKYANLEQATTASSWIPTTGAAATRAADVVTGSGLIYTNVTDATAVYSAGTTYALGAVVRYSSKLWESLQAGNVGHTPDTSPTYWLDLGADNIHAAFDTTVSTVSSTTTEMIYVIKPGSINSLALINMEAQLANVALFDPTDGVVYTSTYGLSGGTTYNWYEYFFNDPLTKRTQVVATDIPMYTNGLVTIKLSSDTGVTVSVAQIILGTLTEIGSTQYGAKVGIIDYSKKETDEFGNTTFVQRNFSKRLTAEVHLANSELNKVQRFLYSIRAKPSVWIASSDPTYEEALIVYGFYRDFSTDISYPTVSFCSLEIEGLT